MRTILSLFFVLITFGLIAQEKPRKFMVSMEGGYDQGKGKTIFGANTESNCTYVMPTVAYDLYKRTYAGIGVAYVEYQMSYIETDYSHGHRGLFAAGFIEQQFKITPKFRVFVRGGVLFGRGRYTSSPMESFEGENVRGNGKLLAVGMQYQPVERLSISVMPLNMVAVDFDMMKSLFVAQSHSYARNVLAMLRVGYHF